MATLYIMRFRQDFEKLWYTYSEKEICNAYLRCYPEKLCAKCEIVEKAKTGDYDDLYTVHVVENLPRADESVAEDIVSKYVDYYGYGSMNPTLYTEIAKFNKVAKSCFSKKKSSGRQPKR